MHAGVNASRHDVLEVGAVSEESSRRFPDSCGAGPDFYRHRGPWRQISAGVCQALIAAAELCQGAPRPLHTPLLTPQF